MTAHPWLQESPWPTKQLPRDELTPRIEKFLATHWMGVLCTLGNDGPIGSPVDTSDEALDGLVASQSTTEWLPVGSTVTINVYQYVPPDE